MKKENERWRIFPSQLTISEFDMKRKDQWIPLYRKGKSIRQVISRLRYTTNGVNHKSPLQVIYEDKNSMIVRHYNKDIIEGESSEYLEYYIENAKVDGYYTKTIFDK